MPHDPIPTTEPKRARSGDTIAWTRRVPGHSHEDGWSLRYAFAGPDTLQVDAEPGPEPDLYLVTVTAAESSSLPAGGYRWVARVRRTDGGELERHTVGDGRIVIEADLASLDDGRTHAEKMVSLLEESLLSIRTDRVAQVSINGRSITYRGEEGDRQLEKLLRFWEDRVRAERGRSAIGSAKVTF